MKVKVPLSLKFGSRNFPIELDQFLLRDNGHLGETHYRKEAIILDAHCSNGNKFITLIHEVLHIINDQYQTNLDEDNIDRISEGIADLLINGFGFEFDWSNFDIKNTATAVKSTYFSELDYYADNTYKIEPLHTDGIGKGTTCYDCVLFKGEVCYSGRGPCEECSVYKTYQGEMKDGK